jgi:hypothetical protein
MFPVTRDLVKLLKVLVQTGSCEQLPKAESIDPSSHRSREAKVQLLQNLLRALQRQSVCVMTSKTNECEALFKAL